jgi:hypothetical protein
VPVSDNNFRDLGDVYDKLEAVRAAVAASSGGGGGTFFSASFTVAITGGTPWAAKDAVGTLVEIDLPTAFETWTGTADALSAVEIRPTMVTVALVAATLTSAGNLAAVFVQGAYAGTITDNAAPSISTTDAPKLRGPLAIAAQNGTNFSTNAAVYLGRYVDNGGPLMKTKANGKLEMFFTANGAIDIGASGSMYVTVDFVKP